MTTVHIGWCDNVILRLCHELELFVNLSITKLKGAILDKWSIETCPFRTSNESIPYTDEKTSP